MSLTAGARLGPYEIVSPVGAGGMGEVYRARDTRLDRTVAIKILPSALAADASLRERFDREARAVSSLQHPHICALFDVGEAPVGGDTIRFLVLEFLEGETLAERLARSGALPPPEALRIAIEACDALHAAHRAGIVHRDLKPANVFLVRRGGSAGPTVKLLDFGLAKAAAPVVNSTSISMLPTTPPGVTAQGAILGTFQYMAPEQIEGLEADARTDIFAFGATLFEMLTGRPAFQGKTRAQLLGAILKDEPPAVSSLQPSVPRAVDRIVATCVAKDPEDRWQSARDLLRELRWAAAPGQDTIAPPHRAKTWQLRAAVAALALATLAAGFLAAAYLRVQPSAHSIQFSIASPQGTTITGGPPGGGTGEAPQLAVSPDGTAIVFVASSGNHQLWIRELSSVDARPIPGTQGAAFPFWSPDSRHVGFFSDGKLKRVSMGAGPPQELCDAPAGRGGAWSDGGVIVFTPATVGGLQQVPANGGPCVDVTVLDAEYGETNHRFPWFLPDGRRFLYTATVGTCCPAAKPGRIRVGILDGNESSVLVEADSSAIYVRNHLLFTRDGTLIARPFAPSTLALGENQFALVEDVAFEGSRYSSFSMSHSGVLAYAGGSLGSAMTRLTWFDRAGRRLGTLSEPGAFSVLELDLSPHDGTVAVSALTSGGTNRDVLLIDTTAARPDRLTFHPENDNAPVFSWDGRHLAFSGSRNGTPVLMRKPVSGTSDEELLLSGKDRLGAILPTGWSRDDRIIYARSLGTKGSLDIWWLPLGGARTPLPYLQTDADEVPGEFSPDGRWVVYQSTDRGDSQVYVQAFPTPGRKYQLSQRGGSNPIWRADGREVIFLGPDGQVIGVPVDTSDGFRSDGPIDLFTVRTRPGFRGRQFDVTRDGQRLLVNELAEQATQTSLTVVTNALSTIQR